MFVIHFCLFSFRYWRAVCFPPTPSLQREVNSRSVFYSGHFHPKSARYTTLAGCRWSIKGLQTETSQQKGRPEWPNCTLNLKCPPTPLSFYLWCPSLLSFSLHVVLVLSRVFKKTKTKKHALRRTTQVLFLQYNLETVMFLCQYLKIPCLV